MSFFISNNLHIKSSAMPKSLLVNAAVAFAHFAILFILVTKFNRQDKQTVLSFSVNVMDVAMSSNSEVSSKASTSSKKSFVEKADLDQSSKHIVKKAENKKEESLNSKEQTAVINPKESAIYDAAYLNNSAPSYPEASRRLGEQGLVVLIVFVDIDGVAKKVEVKNSSGYKRLDLAALETVKNWRFVPAKDKDKSVASWVEVPVNFVLEKNNG